jgi:hypothetical protein
MTSAMEPSASFTHLELEEEEQKPRVSEGLSDARRENSRDQERDELENEGGGAEDADEKDAEYDSSMFHIRNRIKRGTQTVRTIKELYGAYSVPFSRGISRG